jgi:hypothetical protein
MARWGEFEAAEPEFADRVRAMFLAHKHHMMATVRLDGSPRVSGTEVEFADGEVRVGMMAAARRIDDLRRDPRLAIHSQGIDPPEDNPGAWPGEAKMSGRAIEVEASQRADGSHRFHIDVMEAVITHLSDPPERLIIEFWRPGQALQHFERD